MRLPSRSNSIPASGLGWRVRAPELRSAVAGEPGLNRIPQRAIDNRQVFARMGLFL
jgi:hypothetical protein